MTTDTYCRYRGSGVWPGRWIDDVPRVKPIKKLILDLDSSVGETYGQQEGSVHNGSFHCEGYHRIFCFNQDGQVQAGLLRHGNMAGSHDWRLMLVAVIDRYRTLDMAKSFRADGACAISERYELLEADSYRYAIRLPPTRS